MWPSARLVEQGPPTLAPSDLSALSSAGPLARLCRSPWLIPETSDPCEEGLHHSREARVLIPLE
eukprot:13255996-Alexandrium_andersonii.AAC.1